MLHGWHILPYKFIASGHESIVSNVIIDCSQFSSHVLKCVFFRDQLVDIFVYFSDVIHDWDSLVSIIAVMLLISQFLLELGNSSESFKKEGARMLERTSIGMSDFSKKMNLGCSLRDF